MNAGHAKARTLNRDTHLIAPYPLGHLNYVIIRDVYIQLYRIFWNIMEHSRKFKETHEWMRRDISWSCMCHHLLLYIETPHNFQIIPV